MQTIDCIKTRRSVRAFKEEKIPHEVINEVVEAASFAPSWKNTQTVRYIVIEDRALIEKLADECVLGFEYNSRTMKKAPALIVVTTIGKRSGYERDGTFSTSKGSHWESFDAGVAAQTFCLAAHEKGLGTVIMGIFDEQKTALAIDLPEGQSVSALISTGYPAESPAAPKRKSVEELVRYI